MNTFGTMSTIPFRTALDDFWRTTPLEDFLNPSTMQQPKLTQTQVLSVDFIEGKGDATIHFLITPLFFISIDL